MTTTTFITSYCDKAGCGNRYTTTTQDEHCYPAKSRWAELSWFEPAEGKEHDVYRTLNLCPDTLNAILKWMTSYGDLAAGE